MAHRLLYAFMPRAMGMLEELRPELRGRRDEDLALVEDKTVGLRPGGVGHTAADGLLLGEDLWQGQQVMAQCVEEGKLRPGECLGLDAATQLVLVAAGQSISRGVQLARLVFHLKAVSKQLAYPRMLWYGGEALVEKVLKAVVVRPYNELRGPQV